MPSIACSFFFFFFPLCFFFPSISLFLVFILDHILNICPNHATWLLFIQGVSLAHLCVWIEDYGNLHYIYIYCEMHKGHHYIYIYIHTYIHIKGRGTNPTLPYKCMYVCISQILLAYLCTYLLPNL